MGPARKLLKPFFLFILVLLVGVVGYHGIEGWSYFDSLYMTVITLATVGYGEVHLLSTAGRTFTMVLILGGMGILLYSVTELTAFFVEGEMRGLLRKRKMERQIKHYTGHSIVCGAGTIGKYAVEELVATKRPCVVIEQDPEKAKLLLESGVLVVEGDATEEETLIAAGVEQASGLIAALPSDKDNLYVVITARGLNQNLRIISRIEEERSHDKFLRSGADGTVSANYIGGLRMISQLLRPVTVNFLDSMLRTGDGLRVDDLPIGPESPLAGKTLAESELGSRLRIIVLAVKRGNAFEFNPPASTVIDPNDTLVVIGTPEQLSQLH